MLEFCQKSQFIYQQDEERILKYEKQISKINMNSNKLVYCSYRELNGFYNNYLPYISIYSIYTYTLLLRFYQMINPK